MRQEAIGWREAIAIVGVNGSAIRQSFLWILMQRTPLGHCFWKKPDSGGCHQSHAPGNSESSFLDCTSFGMLGVTE